MTKLLKLLTSIVSGAASGAERGGLDAAIALGLGWGGWARSGWNADDGAIPEIYRDRMRQTSSPDRGMAVRLNIQDSDGTLLLSFRPELVASAAFVSAECERQRKAFLHLVLPAGDRSSVPEAVCREVANWVAEDGIQVLNVAGPLEREDPGIQSVARDALVWIFEDEIAPAVRERTSVSVFLGELDSTPRPPGLADVERLVETFYGLPGNGVGGALHVVLDDGNWERAAVAWCRDKARDQGDVAGERFAEFLLDLSDDQLREWIGKDYGCHECDGG